MSDSSQEPPKPRRRLRSDPLGLGEDTPSRNVGLDPLGLGKAQEVDPLALAQQLLALTEEPAAPPQAPPPPESPAQLPTLRSGPPPRSEPPSPPPAAAPQKLSLERAADRLTRKLPALEPVSHPEPPAPPPPDPEEKIEQLLLERVGDPTRVTRKMSAIRDTVDPSATELPLERVTYLEQAPKTRMVEDSVVAAPMTRLIEDPPEEKIKPPEVPERRPTEWHDLIERDKIAKRHATTQKMPAVRPTKLIQEPPSVPAPVVKSRFSRAEPPRLSFWARQKLRLRRLIDPKARITTDDIVIFTRQFCAMVNAGLAMHHSLYFYAEAEPDKALSKVIHDVADRLGDGNSLSNSLKKYPEVFSEVYVGLIAAGESTGMLAAVLTKLADLSEKNQRIRNKVISTLTYPAVLIAVSLMCIVSFLYFVMPMLVPLFTTLGVELPLPTRMLLEGAALLKNPITVGILVGTPIFLWLFWPALANSLRSDPERLRMLHRIPLQLPVVGRMVEKIITARIMFSMASLLESGYALSATLEKCEKVAGNAEIAYRLKMARRMLVEGSSAADCLGNAGVFPSGAIQMIAVGEETSALSEMISRVAQVYEEDIEMTLLDLAALIEPLILIVMGGIVSFIVLSAVLPMVQLLDKL